MQIELQGGSNEGLGSKKMEYWGQKGNGHKIRDQQSLCSLCSAYLKHFFIQDAGTKDNHSMGVQQWASTSGERPGDPLLAVNYEGDRLALHSHSHTVPPGHGGREWVK